MLDAREQMGIKLAARIKQQLGEELVKTLDVVIPIPETANVAARCTAEHLQLPLVEGFQKNRYVFRTFILPNASLRQTGVRRKLNAIGSKFKGKNVLLVDDSVVRGTTSREIVALSREAGARSVYFASCAPAVTHPHIYGIDLASSSELIAHHKSSEEIAKDIDADAMIYQSLEDLQDACAEVSPRPNQRFEVGVFSGRYVTPVPDGYFEHLEQVRGQRKKQKVQEDARNAVSKGVAKEDQLRMVTEGAEVDPFGQVVPASDSVATNGRARAAQEAADNFREQAMVSNSQDITLDNMADHER